MSLKITRSSEKSLGVAPAVANSCRVKMVISGYGLQSGLWPTAVFTQAPLAISGCIFLVSTGFGLT